MAEGSVITEKGRALLGKILATNSTLNITGAQIGSGDLPAGTPPASMTALASYVMDATIVAISTPAAGEVMVVLQVLSNDVETAFLAKEVALLAADPDEGDVVYCNETARNADVRRLTVRVTDGNGVPAAGANVDFCILNNCEWYPAATVQTDAAGMAALTCGLGSLRLLARRDSLSCEAFVSPEETGPVVQPLGSPV